jgi:hypothetical protein
MKLARFAAVLVLPATLSFAGPVAAQDATPQALAPAACAAEPVSYEAFASLIALPATPFAPEVAATPGPPILPAGEPAGEEIATAVRDTIAELVGCLNTGETMRILALYSDRFIAETFAGLEITQEEYEQELAAATPREPGQEVQLFAYSEVVLLDDGRAAVLVLGDDQLSPGPATETLFYLVDQGGEWKVDATVETPDENEGGV